MLTKSQRKRIAKIQRLEDTAVYQWHTPIDLARLCSKTRLTIYRWIAAGYVERKHLSRRSILVRMRANVSVSDLPTAGETARTRRRRRRAA